MMAQSWRDYRRDNRDKIDKTTDPDPETGHSVPIVPIVHALPAPIEEGLKRLQEMPAPRLLKPEVWPEVVKDAVRLSSDGWVAKALGLGWTELDLFGAVTDARGDPFGDGLAAWLEGRKLLALTADKAIACDRDGTRHYFLLPRGTGGRLLWSLGGGR